jgi:hypothetical protein
MYLQEVGCEGTGWIKLVQDMDKWLALVNAEMKHGFHNIQEISRLAENRLASREGFCSME